MPNTSPGVPALGLSPGMQLGRYRLIRQLAIGGMAEVYLAQAVGIERFQKLVVLKRILPQFAASPQYVRMFLDEARLLALLDHPNIVQVFDIGSQIGNYYFAMEFVQGKDVREILSTAGQTQTPIPLGCAISIVQGVCRGLHYAHERCDDAGVSLGIVHRDVSPSNVQISYDGSTKLLDFGVAKATSNEQQTTGGSLKGKVAYMSPEQCLGAPIDRRSDVFALGILLFEITTGTRLFRGGSELDILQQIAHGRAPSPKTRRADYPDELEQIVRRALARDRDERYATALELERDLDAFALRERLGTSPRDVSDLLRVLFPEEADLMPQARSRTLIHGKPVDAPPEPSIIIVDQFGDTPSHRADGTPPTMDRPRARALGSVSPTNTREESVLLLSNPVQRRHPRAKLVALVALLVIGAALAVPVWNRLQPEKASPALPVAAPALADPTTAPSQAAPVEAAAPPSPAPTAAAAPTTTDVTAATAVTADPTAAPAKRSSRPRHSSSRRKRSGAPATPTSGQPDLDSALLPDP